MPPVVAPGITKPTKLVPVLETTMADVPPIVNAVGLPKFVPVIVTNVPTEPDEGEKEHADWKANKLPVFDLARDYSAARSDYTVWFDDVMFLEMPE